mmetsp:Transcript_1198/g.3499  ORF Transcript_1198/g.3499 Transcript_1198/m.3499 type:complete len:203 (-) Transcript_1198:242-850(-)
MQLMEFPWSTDLAIIATSRRDGWPIDTRHSQRKYIVTIRDPRDAALSSAHFVYAAADNPNQYILEAGCKENIAATAFYYYWQVERQGTVYPTLPVWYRDSVDQPFHQVVELLRFLGLRAPAAVISKVVKETSFEVMKAKEERHELPGPNNPGTEHAKVRKGHYGTFREEMSQEAIASCNADMKRVLPDIMQRRFGLLSAEEM